LKRKKEHPVKYSYGATFILFRREGWRNYSRSPSFFVPLAGRDRHVDREGAKAEKEEKGENENYCISAKSPSRLLDSYYRRFADRIPDSFPFKWWQDRGWVECDPSDSNRN